MMNINKKSEYNAKFINMLYISELVFQMLF